LLTSHDFLLLEELDEPAAASLSVTVPRSVMMPTLFVRTLIVGTRLMMSMSRRVTLRSVTVRPLSFFAIIFVRFVLRSIIGFFLCILALLFRTMPFLLVVLISLFITQVPLCRFVTLAIRVRSDLCFGIFVCRTPFWILVR
jgi:hypothetical protein